LPGILRLVALSLAKPCFWCGVGDQGPVFALDSCGLDVSRYYAKTQRFLIYQHVVRGRVMWVVRQRSRAAMKSVVAIILGSVLAFGAITWWALESSGVAVLRTQRSDGSPREIRLWYVEHDGTIWVEAATAARGFLLDIRRTPEVILSRGSEASAYHAEVLDRPSGHARVRALLRGKYGCRDWWVGLLQDTSRFRRCAVTPLGQEPGWGSASHAHGAGRRVNA
jgi:hypothetical protein